MVLHTEVFYETLTLMVKAVNQVAIRQGAFSRRFIHFGSSRHIGDQFE
jgi:hypothetical protein